MRFCCAYDPNKIFGVCSLMEMRANTIIGEYLGIDPAAVRVPIVGGTSNLTAVPLLSHAKPYSEFTLVSIHLRLFFLNNNNLNLPNFLILTGNRQK